MPDTTQHPDYNPNAFLDAIMHHLKLHGDDALARHLKLARNVVRAIREGKVPLVGTLLMTISQETGIGIAQLREMLGDRRARLRLGFAG